MGTQSLNLLFKGNVRSLAEYDVDTRLCAAPRLSQGGRYQPHHMKSFYPTANRHFSGHPNTTPSTAFGLHGYPTQTTRPPAYTTPPSSQVLVNVLITVKIQFHVF